MHGRVDMGGYEHTIFVLITAHVFGLFLDLVKEFRRADHESWWSGALTPTILNRTVIFLFKNKILMWNIILKYELRF